MKQFDRQMRLKTQKERWTASAEARTQLMRTMETAAGKGPQRAKGTRWSAAVLAAGAACAAIALAALTLPRKDILNEEGALHEPVNVMVLAQGDKQPIRPEAALHVTASEAAICAEAVFRNQTEDIWLLRWSARLPGETEYRTSPLIWLETGVQYSDTLEWQRLGQQDEQAVVEWKYEAYRVTADILHWVDGDWLKPGQEGYEEQQDLLTAAWEARALILSAGDWPDGQAGEMQLVLPDAQMTEDILAYYLKIGALEEGAAEQEAVSAADGQKQ